MIHSISRFRFSAAPFFSIAMALVSQSEAATYNWLELNSTGATNTASQQWLQRGNYAEFPDPGNTGTFTVTKDDIFVFDAGSRGVTVNSSGAIGKLVIGAGFVATNVSQSGSSVLTLESGGEGVTSAGIEIASGRSANTNIHVRLRLLGDIVITNNGSSRLRLGNTDNGNGGLEGSGTLAIRGGIVLLPDPVSHTYSGDVTVSNGGTLQTQANVQFNTYSSLTVGSGGSLTGNGSFGGATVHSGGRISPGGEGNPAAAPVALSFTNLLTLQSTGLVVLDVKAAGNDVVNAAGGVQLGGELRLRLNTDYVSEGVHQLFQGISGTSGNFDQVTIQTDATGSTSVALVNQGNGLWEGEFTSRNYGVSFDAATGALTLTAIPEPASASLMGALGFLAILIRRR